MKSRTKGFVSVGGVLLIIVLGTAAWALSAASRPQVTSVDVARTSIDGSLGITPLNRSINDSATAQQLYQAVRSLPRVLPGTPEYQAYCPLDQGIRYQMTFHTASQVILQATFEAGGCRWVRIGKDELYKTDSSFWQLLANALNISSDSLFATPVGA
jgi:hypothetical protein